MGERRRAPVVAAIVFVLGLGGWLLLNSPVFAVRRIEVIGNGSLTSREVVTLSGVQRGENLFRLSVDAIETAVRRSPWVAEVEVERRWPSTVVLDLRERTSVAWVRTPGGAGAVIAGDGVVLAGVAELPRDLPTLGAVGATPIPGARVDAPQPALRVAASFPPALRAVVAAVRAGEGGVTLRLRSGAIALYGAPASLTAKNAALLSLLRQAERDRTAIEYVDVRVPTAPAVKPA